MKASSRILSLLLAVLMLTSLCVPVLAAEGKEEVCEALQKGTGYVAIGDSFTRGYGASDHWETQLYENEKTTVYECRNVDGSYPNLVADYFGLYAPNDIRKTDAKLWHLSHDAVSTAYVLDLLGIDDGYRDDEFLYQNYNLKKRYSTDLAYFADEESYTLDGTARCGKEGSVMSVRDLIENASLISIGLGQTDVFYRTLQLAFMSIDFNNAETLPAGIAGLVEMLYESFEYWKGAYPLLLDYIKESNPDAEVVLVGTMNPLANTLLAEDIAVPIGSAVNFLLDLMNKFTKECAEKYGYIFVDITNVDIYPAMEDVTLSEMLSLDLGGDEWAIKTHPSPSGYAQIARSIESALEEKLSSDPPAVPATYIKLDVGRFESVDYVMLDGDLVKNFTVNNHVITIPCYTTTADTLAVSVVKEDGTVTVMTYSLKFENGAYTAHRTYVTNDAGSLVRNIIDKIIQFIKSIFTTLFGALK